MPGIYMKINGLKHANHFFFFDHVVRCNTNASLMAIFQSVSNLSVLKVFSAMSGTHTKMRSISNRCFFYLHKQFRKLSTKLVYIAYVFPQFNT